MPIAGMADARLRGPVRHAPRAELRTLRHPGLAGCLDLGAGVECFDGRGGRRDDKAPGGFRFRAK
jgi:hypothetical protein